MVPVEPISLSIGIASLFSTCVECFDYFKAAQSLAEDLKILLVKLDIEKTRLLIWGNAVGILKVDENERAPALRDPVKVEVIEKCLHQIKGLFLGTEKLQKTYGLKPATIDEGKRDPRVDPLSHNSMNDFKTSYKRFWVRNKGSSGSPSLISKTKWAIHDKAKFEDLRTHLKEFVDGLYHILPISKDSQDRTIQGDICSILDLNRLKLVKSACSESNYESWAEMAGEVIAESEAGTVDRRNMEEWLRDIADFEHEPTAQPSGESTIPFKDGLSSATRVYFVFTSECLNLQSPTPCAANTLGTMVFDEDRNFGFTPPHEFANPWSLGRKISVSRFPQGSKEFKFDDHLRIYIYCPPCGCLIHTALSLCKELSSPSTYRTVWVRPDDRLTASCCYDENRSSWLEAVAEKSKEIEANTYFKEPSGVSGLHIRHLDRTWVEQRIFYGEDDQGMSLSARAQDLRGILEKHPRDNKCAAIIIVGELSHSAQLMRSSPFKYKGKPPKATQIYKFEKASDAGLWKATYEGTFTPKNFTASATPSTRPLPNDSLRPMASAPINAPKGPKRPRLNDTRLPMATSARTRDYEEMEDLYDA